MWISTFAATQDIAIDGLTCKIFVEDERHIANSMQYGSNLFGNVIGGGVILMFYPWLQWRGALWLLAILTFITLIQVVFFKEPETDSQFSISYSRQKLKNIVDDAILFIKNNRYWFFLLIISPVGFSAGFSLLNPILVDAGWSLGRIGFTTQVFGSIVGIISAISAGFLIKRFGRKQV